MPTTHEYVLTDTIEQAAERLDGLLSAAGYSSARQPDGTIAVTRGSVAATVVFGAMAGKNMQVRYDLVLVESAGRVMVRMSSDAAGGLVRGGIVGMRRAAAEFDRLVALLGTGLASAGVLLEER